MCTFQVEANMMNPHPHSISCPQRTFEQFIKELSTKELSVKLMKDVQDRIAQMKQRRLKPIQLGNQGYLITMNLLLPQ